LNHGDLPPLNHADLPPLHHGNRNNPASMLTSEVARGTSKGMEHSSGNVAGLDILINN
jgi:hypothetical protein